MFTDIDDTLTSDGRLPAAAFAALERLHEAGLAVEERLFTVEEAYAATEAFNTSASSIVLPVVQIDGRPVGTGKPGPLGF